MEARFVAGKIQEHLRADRDIRAAVLYRTNSQSRVFEEAMRRAGLPYNIVGGFSFYERMEVRDIIAYLKLALNPNDSIALQRVINTPPRGIGKETIDEIEIRARESWQLLLGSDLGTTQRWRPALAARHHFADELPAHHSRAQRESESLRNQPPTESLRSNQPHPFQI